MYELYEITEEDYLTAAENGVNRYTLECRLMEGWCIDDAIKIPYRRKRGGITEVWLNHKAIAEKNGISKTTFINRIRDMDGRFYKDPLKAASTPLLRRGK